MWGCTIGSTGNVHLLRATNIASHVGGVNVGEWVSGWRNPHTSAGSLVHCEGCQLLFCTFTPFSLCFILFFFPHSSNKCSDGENTSIDIDVGDHMVGMSNAHNTQEGREDEVQRPHNSQLICELLFGERNEVKLEESKSKE